MSFMSYLHEGNSGQSLQLKQDLAPVRTRLLHRELPRRFLDICNHLKYKILPVSPVPRYKPKTPEQWKGTGPSNLGHFSFTSNRGSPSPRHARPCTLRSVSYRRTPRGAQQRPLPRGTRPPGPAAAIAAAPGPAPAPALTAVTSPRHRPRGGLGRVPRAGAAPAAGGAGLRRPLWRTGSRRVRYTALRPLRTVRFLRVVCFLGRLVPSALPPST